jgi:hypothetical protein
MADASTDFGEWFIAPDGIAHCIVAGKCLCGAAVDVAAAPRLKATDGTTIDTPLCNRCVDLNARRLKMR